MRVVVTGSIAFDYLMSFPGTFTEHILPEHLSRVSLSFLVDSMDKRRGGCAPNIAYTLALLGERPILLAAAGQDFAEYRAFLDAAGVDTAFVYEVPGTFTASFFCSTDRANNQIASFYTGAMAHAAELSFRTAGAADFAVISPNDPTAMVQYAEECRTIGLPFMFDPGQQSARMSGAELGEGLQGARILICNDYELELVKQKTRLDEGDLLTRTGCLVVTRGDQGSVVVTPDGTATTIAAVPPQKIADPTGVGDAYRGGFLKGLVLGLPYRTCAELGSVAATYALEHMGGQSHAFTWDEFEARYVDHFGPLVR